MTNTTQKSNEPKPRQTKPKEKDSQAAQTEAIPDYTRVALVPIANPETASALLHLAVALAHPEEGKVIALIVSTSSMENEAKVTEQLQSVMDELAEEGHTVELETVIATSISRGILDEAREHGADLIILGIRQPARGQVVLGTVVESVIETAPCDVLLYRTSVSPEFSRIVVPVDEEIQAQAAARLGIRLADGYDARIEAMYVQSRYRSQYEGLAYIEKTLDGAPGHRKVKRTVIHAQNSARAILTRVNEDDMIMVGFTQRSEFERLVFGDMPRELLNHAEGPVIVVVRSIGGDKLPARFYRRVMSFIHPALTRVEQEEIIGMGRDNATVDIDYVILIIVSATLATLGLILNSAAVIIGAMLVAPFMSPLIALSTGITIGNPVLGRRAVYALGWGIFLSLLVATLIGTFLPNLTITSEMASRGAPTLVDAAVALASGVVGAYATARKDIPAALAGVAIAAALMPPLCTVGLGLALDDTSLALGAAVLFTTNIICIIISGAVVFAWLGMSPRRGGDKLPIYRAMISLTLVILFAIPTGAALFQLTRQAQREDDIGRHLRLAFSPVEVAEVDVTFDESPTLVRATVRSPVFFSEDEISEVERRIEAEIGRDITLEVTVWQTVRSSPIDVPEVIPLEVPEVTPEATLETTPESTPEVED